MNTIVRRLSRIKNSYSSLTITSPKVQITLPLSRTELEAIEMILGWYVDANGNVYNFSEERVKELTRVVKDYLVKSGQLTVMRSEKKVDGETLN